MYFDLRIMLIVQIELCILSHSSWSTYENILLTLLMIRQLSWEDTEDRAAAWKTPKIP